MNDVKACQGCLRRSWLLGRLGAYIENVCADARGKRTPELLALDNDELVAAVGGADGGRILAEVSELSEARMKAAIERAGCWAHCRHDGGFPAGLGDAPDAPWLLIGVGEKLSLPELATDASVTVVGARRASSYGLEVARSISRELTAAGLLVISGMALGIDGAAHRGAVEAGPTLAVLGCGADRAYPVSHTRLYRRIAESGLVISEMPPGSRAWRWSFPARNRIMAALSQMTVVIEAASRSGSLITAEMAIDAGREVGAVPGQVTSSTSAGTNELIAGGAALIRDGRDVLDRMVGVGASPVAPAGPEPGKMARAILEAVEPGRGTCEGVAARLGLDAGEVAAGLARLEIAGYLSGSPFGHYTRTTLDLPNMV